METFLGIAVGIGLSAACGFRVFVPLLVMNLASLVGQLHLSPGFSWIGSYYATVAFGTAPIVEILGYYIAWLDHLLDMVATPAAIIAGTITTASMVTDMSPFLKWTLALIAGGGIAGLVQGVLLHSGQNHQSLRLGLETLWFRPWSWPDQLLRLCLPSWSPFSPLLSSHSCVFLSSAKRVG